MKQTKTISRKTTKRLAKGSELTYTSPTRLGAPVVDARLTHKGRTIEIEQATLPIILGKVKSLTRAIDEALEREKLERWNATARAIALDNAPTPKKRRRAKG